MGAKINVAISSNRGLLRLRWTYQGERFVFHTGLEDCKTNRQKLQKTILQIEADCEAGAFDTSLSKYQRQHNAIRRSVIDLVDEWIKYKATHLDRRTINTFYRTLRGNIVTQFPDRLTQSLLKEDCLNFMMWLRDERKLHPETIRRRLEALSACWAWAIDQGFTFANPWENLFKLIKVPAREPPAPFTLKEIEKIIQGFEVHSTYSPLVPFVKFLLATGCRTGEAIGLRWSDLSPNCGSCTIRTQLTDGKRKPTKTGKSRSLRLPHATQEMLLKMRACADSELVFTYLGKPIDARNFRNRPWKQILEAEKIPYRKPYNCRHTFISHALERGLNPVAVAEMTGHDVAVLFKHYAGCIGGLPQLPDLF